jgi:hypothetical protein
MICLHQVTHTYFCWETVNIHNLLLPRPDDRTVVQLIKYWVPQHGSDCHCHTIWDSKIPATAVIYIARNDMIKNSELKRM